MSTNQSSNKRKRPANPSPGAGAAAVAAISGATVVVGPRGAARVCAGHPWVYRSDIVSTAGAEAGALAGVEDQRGHRLGTALYSSSSQIAIRMIARERIESREALLALLRQRLQAAFEYRQRVITQSDAYRVVFSEADLLPGIIVDRYSDLLSLEVLTQAMDAQDIRAVVLEELVGCFAPAGIVERVEPRIRELEQLPERAPGLLMGQKSSTIFTMNGVRLRYDGLSGQKTGAFLDQRDNYAAAAQYAFGGALDVFCYQGGFALHLARRCTQVTGVDSSRTALEGAEENERLNRDHHSAGEIEWLEANAFDLLRDYSDAGRRYDTLVLDPPAFAKTQRTLDTALRGYKELNLRALKMLRPGGILVTCSCSYHVNQAAFLDMLASAANDAHRAVRLLEVRGQAKDHPVLLGAPETHYLKCVICAVR